MGFLLILCILNIYIQVSPGGAPAFCRLKMPPKRLFARRSVAAQKDDQESMSKYYDTSRLLTPGYPSQLPPVCSHTLHNLCMDDREHTMYILGSHQASRKCYGEFFVVFPYIWCIRGVHICESKRRPNSVVFRIAIYY